MCEVPMYPRSSLGYRGISLMEKCPTLGPYNRPVLRALWWSFGGKGGASYEPGVYVGFPNAPSPPPPHTPTHPADTDYSLVTIASSEMVSIVVLCRHVRSHQIQHHPHQVGHGTQRLARCVGQHIGLDVQRAVMALVVRQ